MNLFTEFIILNKLPLNLKLNIKFFYVFGVTGNELLFVTNDDKVYAMGDNNDGCLGIDVNNRTDLKIQLKLKPTIVHELCNKQIIIISHGLHHVIALSLSGDIYSWGNNSYGQLGNGTRVSNCIPIKVELNCDKITSVCCGFYHSIVLTETGNIYSFGQIGTKFNNTQLTPINVVKYTDSLIVAIACGDFYGLALDKNGQLYSWSYKTFVQIDNENSEVAKLRAMPINNLVDFRVRKMVCGVNQCLILTTAEHIFSISNKEIHFNSYDNKRQINSIEVTINNLHGNKLKFIDTAASIYCGIYAILSSDGKYFIWEKCGNGNVETPQECSLSSFHEIFANYGENKVTYLPLYMNNNHFQTQYSINETSDQSSTDLIEDYKNTLLIEKRKRDKLILKRFLWSASIKMAKNSQQKSIYKSLYAFMQSDCGLDTDDEDIEEYDYIDCDNMTRIFDSCYNSYLNFDDNYIQTGRYSHEFEEIELKGRGGFGSVYKALNKFDEKHYAIKKIKDANLCDNTLREIRVWANMSSRYVVQYNSAWIELNDSPNDDSSLLSRDKSIERTISGSIESKSSLLQNNAIVYIQMELCCSTLKHIIGKINTELNQINSELNFRSLNPVGYYIACELFLEILECVQYLHTLNKPVIHRDLKPSNILITDGSNGRFVKIADFGLATMHLFSEQSHTVALGTQQYMAPEVKNSRKYDTKVDMYSLGLIMKELFNLNLENDTSIYESTPHRLNLRSKCVSVGVIYHNLVSSVPSRRHTCEYIINLKNLWALSLDELITDESFVQYEKYLHSNSDQYTDMFCAKLLRQRYSNHKFNQRLIAINPIENQSTDVGCLGIVDASNYLIEVLETIKQEQSGKIQQDFSSEKIEQVFKDRKNHHNITLIIEKGAKLEGISNASINNIKASIDFKTLKTEIYGDITLPELKLSGIYSLDGKLFKFLPITGNGQISLHLQNLNGNFVIVASVKENKLFTADIVDIKMSFSSVNLYFENLIDENMSPFLNSMINFLAKPLIDKLVLENRQQMEKINARIKKAFNKKLKYINFEGFMNFLK